eukprot:2342797-Amphidinium_carterae.1
MWGESGLLADLLPQRESSNKETTVFQIFTPQVIEVLDFERGPVHMLTRERPLFGPLPSLDSASNNKYLELRRHANKLVPERASRKSFGSYFLQRNVRSTLPQLNHFANKEHRHETAGGALDQKLLTSYQP